MPPLGAQDGRFSPAWSPSGPQQRRSAYAEPVSTMPLPRVLAQVTRDPGRPRLTWYGDDERVELSGHVLDNWVTKTANLLVEEYQAGPGTQVLVDLPVHWRTLVWAMAVWRVGAAVLLPAGSAPAADVVVTDRPAGHGGEVVAVALPALARSFDGDLPDDVLDAAATVLGYGDVLTWMPEPDPTASALVLPGRAVPHEDLATWAGAATPDGTAPRVLIEPAPVDAADRGEAVAALLAEALTVYAADGSVVLCSPTVAADLGGDPERRRHLIETEMVTLTSRTGPG